MADYSHSLGMVIGMKNALSIIPDLVGSHDFAVNENCVQYSECNTYDPFIKANKAVFGHEYRRSETGSTVCSVAK